MNREIGEAYQKMYQTFMKDRTAPVGKECDVIPSRQNGVTLSNLKDRIDSLSGEEFVMTMDIVGAEHV